MFWEYFQFEILKIIFEFEYVLVYIFLGGICLYLVYGIECFFEDFDFDNVGLFVVDFEEIGCVV